jgi:hypothetical protein
MLQVTLKVTVQLSALGNPENYRTRGDMCVIGNCLYISITDFPNNNTDLWKVDFKYSRVEQCLLLMKVYNGWKFRK